MAAMDDLRSRDPRSSDPRSSDPPGRPWDLDEQALADRIALRDETAFMTVYDRHADTLFGTALRFLRDRDAAAEVVQEAMHAVWQRIGQFDARSGSMGSWMLGIVRNRALDRLRAKARRPRIVRSGSGSPTSPEAADGGAWGRRQILASGSDDPAAALERRWVRALLRTSLAEMRADEREILVLAYDAGLSQSEIAERLRLPIGTVKSRTRRSLARLRLRLASVPDLRPDHRADPHRAETRTER